MGSNGNQHTITALVQDKPGVLARVASLFRRRGFNIVSLAVGNSERAGLSRMTFVVNGDQGTVDQVTSQMGKLIDVVGISDLSDQETVARELALIKVESSASNRNEIVQLVHLFRASIVDVGSQSLVIEVTGEEDKINALANLLKPFGIKEMMRTGRVAMVRGQAEGRVSDGVGAGRRPEASIQGRVDYEGV
ncbi:MAG: acetolactate synthase small subunit [Dehalococcoidia bacterium]|nr:acetolactate synthase small subunit [Dehalococcoidia bacterium]MSQ17716.1 acetolactate synthase small subunit [Dehalococcoidia bacterium]